MTDEPTKPHFLTIEQAAEELNVKSSLIRGLIKIGELRAIQVGGRGYLARLLRLMRIFPEIRGEHPVQAGFLRGL